MAIRVGEHGNGYVRLTTLVAVGVPVLGLFAGAVALFVSLTIAPLVERLDKHDKAIEMINESLVPRNEHQRYDELQKARFDDLQRQVTKNTDDLKAIYGPSDALKRLQDEVDQMQNDRQPGRGK